MLLPERRGQASGTATIIFSLRIHTVGSLPVAPGLEGDASQVRGVRPEPLGGSAGVAGLGVHLSLRRRHSVCRHPSRMDITCVSGLNPTLRRGPAFPLSLCPCRARCCVPDGPAAAAPRRAPLGVLVRGVWQEGCFDGSAALAFLWDLQAPLQGPSVVSVGAAHSRAPPQSRELAYGSGDEPRLPCSRQCFGWICLGTETSLLCLLVSSFLAFLLVCL